jgi:dTDP-4-dehydrorhamnose reductase
MKVLVTGASGLLGRAVMQAFEGTEVQGLAFSRADPAKNIIKCDLRNPEELRAKIIEYQPDVIIHSAAERRPDVCDANRDLTTYLNINVTEQIAAAAKEVGSWMLYISTDYVFDGTSPPYPPNGTINPLSFYGQTKRAGEERVWKILSGAGVLRVPLLYGDVEALEESAATVLAKSVLSTKPVSLDDWQVRYPTSVDDVARAIRSLCDRKMKHCGLSGTWHFSSNERYSKYQIAVTIGKLFNLPTTHITPDPNPPAGVPRPRDCHLDTTALNLMGFLKLTPFEVGIKKALEKWMNKTQESNNKA